MAWRAWPLGPEAPRLELSWGLEGGDFVLVRGAMPDRGGGAGDLVGALDLRTGRWLRYEVSDVAGP